MRVRILALLFALLLAPVLAAPFAPVRGAGAYVGQVWSTGQIYYAPVGAGAEADYTMYPGRSGHVRFWYRHRTDPSRWWAVDAPISTCLGGTSCGNNASTRPPMSDTWNWYPDHADLIANDDGGYAGGRINDAGWF